MSPTWTGITSDAAAAFAAGFGIAEAAFIAVFAFTILVWMVKKLINAAL